jgi:hypothetical protein
MRYLTYKGKRLPYRVSYYALKHFEEETGKVFEEIEKPAAADLELLIWYALQAGHKAEGIAFDVDRQDVEMVLDECYREILEAAQGGFQESKKKGIAGLFR